MKRIIFIWTMMFLVMSSSAFSQNTIGRPTFTLPHCYSESLLSQPICITQDYLQDEFYVVLKDKPKDAASFTFGYQIGALRTIISNSTVDEYHNERQRIESLPILSLAVKDLVTQTNFDQILHIKIKNPDDFSRTIFQFSQDPGVESISLSSVVHATDLVYNDPLVSEQYMLPMIRATETHEKYGFGSPLSIVAVFDTGGTSNHPDLKNKYAWEHDTTGEPKPFIDHFGHGTHVAGTVAALANNNEGIVGNCPECSLWNIKVLNNGGLGTWEVIVDGILQAISKVDEAQKQNQLTSATFNFSLSGMGPVPIMDAAFEVAYKKDIVIVAAAGNSGLKIGPGGSLPYPASAPGVIVAQAIDASKHYASFSNYTPNLISTECPGVNIISTVPTSGRLSHPSGYLLLSGTSMASPCVAGAIAHVRGVAAQKGKRITRELIHSAILGSVTLIPGHDKFSASGGVLDMISLHDIPMIPPEPLTDFGVFGTSWGSTYLAFTSVNDSVGKLPIGFLVSYSKSPFDENSIDHTDVTTVYYNIKRGAGEGVNLKIIHLEPETRYYVTARVQDRSLNVSLLPDSGVLQFTTPKATLFPGLKWTFTTADGKKDPSGFLVDNGPLALFFRLFPEFESGQHLWHLSDLISDFRDFRWNWWFGNPQTLGYKTSTPSDSVVISPILDLTDMHHGAELQMDYFQQLLSLTTQTQDQFEVHAVILDENNRPLERDKNSIMLLQNIGKANNSTTLKMTPVRMDLEPVRNLWLDNHKMAGDGSLDKMRIIFVFRFVSATRGGSGGIGSTFGNIVILQNP